MSAQQAKRTVQPAADAFGGQLAVGARHHVPKPTGVDEQHLIEPGLFAR
jgi:hypothetical protein